MDFQEICTCPTLEGLSPELSFTFSENEDLEEIDPDELIEDQPQSHKAIWNEINDNFNDKRQEIKRYKLSKQTQCEVPLNPAVQFLEDHIFPDLTKSLQYTIIKAKELECIKHQKNAFNGIDFIAEMLWNLNPRHPERKNDWTYIFDMDWVIKWLEEHPRVYYPFSWIWSREYAATRIQAYMKGYWVRNRPNVQEMRQFWKTIQKEEKQPGSIENIL